MSLPKEGVIIKGCGFCNKSGSHNVYINNTLCYIVVVSKRMNCKVYLGYCKILGEQMILPNTWKGIDKGMNSRL